MTKQICGESNRNDGKGGTIRGRTRRLPAAALALTVALAPSNTERQTVDSLKAAGTAPPCPPFSSMYLSRTFALLSRSNCSSIAVFRSYTRSFFPLLSFCLSCCPCVHFLSSLFTFVLVVHACFYLRFFFHSVFVYPWSKQAHKKTFDFVMITILICLYLVNTQTLLALVFSQFARNCQRTNQPRASSRTSTKAGNRHNAPYQSNKPIGRSATIRPIA